ncbi:MAG: putative lipid II flippase FtsW [Chlamydiae bacterium]|nr:putative lipid II flippase FtsW [Chlamydiota bacterium]
MLNKYQSILLMSVAAIFALGILMVFDISSAEILDKELKQNPHQPVLKQLVYAFLAIMAGIVVYLVGYRTILELSGPLLILFTFFLVLVFVPWVGQEINGAHRWVKIFGISMQPSEFIKCFLPLYFIRVISERKTPIDFKSFMKIFAIMAIPIGLILLEPDNGTVAIILVTLFVLFFLTRVKWIYWLLPSLLCTIVAGFAALQMKHVPDRIRIYLNPEQDLRGKGHQPHQAKIAAGSGGLLGRGIGESLQKMNYLPEARSDYIAAIYAEEFGFLGIMVLIFLYTTIGFLGFYLASKTTFIGGFYLVTILTFLICFQAFVNLGIVSGLLPSKGTSLPFFSQGGSSLFVNFFAMSLVLSAAKEVKKHTYEPIR